MSDYNRGGDRGGNRGGGFGGNRGGGFGGDRGGNRKPSFGGDRRSDRGGFGAPTMHKAKCDGCGNMAELPFKPTGDKPVFCSACFSAKREESGGGDRRDSRGGDRKPSFGGDRRNDRDRRPAGGDVSGLAQKVDALHAKMDKILKSLNLPTEDAHESETVFRAAKEPMAPKKAKVKNVKDGDLKKAISKISAPKVELKKITKKVVKNVAVKKSAVKKVVKKKK